MVFKYLCHDSFKENIKESWGGQISLTHSTVILNHRAGARASEVDFWWRVEAYEFLQFESENVTYPGSKIVEKQHPLAYNFCRAGVPAPWTPPHPQIWP
ncbi:hypothetical protein PoB_003053700 [Plakobranchus ocellatus]|uniref:Uncharacterized protein n=1 Tax=Plakobranchus ocellatus TaxID=259542 RepID=A0AAV4AAY2_9GAST|nr:hypothetical protein PoB_003053700 [Plakobranchus ocellatus]